MSEADFCFDEGQYLADKLQYEREHKYDPNIERIRNQRKEIKRLNEVINRQQGKIERLSNSAKQWEDTAKDLFISKKKQQAEIERLKEDNFIKSQKRANIFEITNAFERGRTDGIKKFAERLKETISNSLYQYWNEGSGGYYLAEDVPDDIDNLVKEMVGE